MRLLICAGGTGGGVYPALAVLQTLLGDEDSTFDVQPLWVGGVGGMEEELVKRAGVSFETIPAAGVHGVGWRALPGNLWQLSRGFLKSRRLLRQFRPDVLLFTGGYLSGPMAMAARSLISRRDAPRPRSLLYVPDIEPGMALKALARVADTIAVTAEESRKYFPEHGRLMITGYPTRPDLRAWEPEKARRTLGLEPTCPTLLVIGGSKGARSINRALIPVLPDLLAEVQVVHVSGKLDWPEVQEAQAKLAGELPSGQANRYHAYPYLYEEMGAALSAADLAISRAGASTLGELPLFGLPAVLVPYPYAWRYQQVNAHYLARHGAAVIVKDADLPGQILGVVRQLLTDLEGLARMREAMRALAHPQAAETLARCLRDMASPLTDQWRNRS